jgi:Flp pilus assembly protein protease CpaA
MTAAAWIVFMGILNYVAYRDIFERRSANLPLVATAPIAVGESRASD